MVCALGLGGGLLLLPGISPAGEARQGPASRRPVSGQEVVNGSYSCTGTVFSDGQAPNVSASAYLNAASGITADFFGNSRAAREVPTDLEAMSAICDAHVSPVQGEVPSICAVGAIEQGRGEFGNGASTGSSFAFSCQGTRDEVVGVIGAVSRAPISTPLR